MKKMVTPVNTVFVNSFFQGSHGWTKAWNQGFAFMIDFICRTDKKWNLKVYFVCASVKDARMKQKWKMFSTWNDPIQQMQIWMIEHVTYVCLIQQRTSSNDTLCNHCNSKDTLRVQCDVDRAKSDRNVVTSRSSFPRPNAVALKPNPDIRLMCRENISKMKIWPFLVHCDEEILRVLCIVSSFPTRI